ncbi:MAG: UDP-N-acetylmuramoyl-L-alanine--D-glutamate ligase [Mariprofundaceae bacterium]
MKQHHAIIGMGKTGISLATFLLAKNETCEAFDENVTALPQDLNITLHTGHLNKADFTAFTHLWVSPGIQWSHPALKKARQAGKIVQGDLSLFVEYCQAPMLAVTGTNGKTTTTHIAHTLLETLPGGCEIGGNIGTPMLDIIKHLCPQGRVALELSSFQLQRSGNLKPRWAVLLNIQSDHADMHDSEAEYTESKLNIFQNQAAGDTAMLPMQSCWDTLCSNLQQQDVQVHRFGQVQKADPVNTLLSAGILVDKHEASLFWQQNNQRQFIRCDDIPTRGLHQHINLAVAAQAAADLGVDVSVIHAAVSSFRGLPHRLRYLGNIASNDWFDDSKATNPAAAQAALSSFDKVIWICGGLRKGLDLEPLLSEISQHVEHAIIIGKDCNPYVALLQKSGIAYSVATHIDKAVQLAARLNKSIPILLSPAAASQDQFQNYMERGEAYQKAIKALKVKS